MKRGRAYVDWEKNAIVLEVDPKSETEKEVTSTILEAAQLYPQFEKTFGKNQKELAKKVRRLEKKEGFVDYHWQKEDYERMRADFSKSENKPGVLVRGLSDKMSQGYFKKILEGLESNVQDEKRRKDKYWLIDNVHVCEEYVTNPVWFGLCTLGTLGIAPVVSKYRKNKYETASRTHEALKYMSNNLEFE